jgi:hypothetical protein
MSNREQIRWTGSEPEKKNLNIIKQLKDEYIDLGQKRQLIDNNYYIQHKAKFEKVARSCSRDTASGVARYMHHQSLLKPHTEQRDRLIETIDKRRREIGWYLEKYKNLGEAQPRIMLEMMQKDIMEELINHEKNRTSNKQFYPPYTPNYTYISENKTLSKCNVSGLLSYR